MNTTSLVATLSPYLKDRRRVAVVLVVMAVALAWLVWPEDPRRRNEIRETRAQTLEDLGFSLPPVTKSDKFSVNLARSGMSYGEIKTALEQDGWTVTEEREPFSATARVGGRRYAVTVPLVTQTLRAKKSTRNRHAENKERFALFNLLKGNYPDADTDKQSLTVKMTAERYIIDIYYDAAWSDRYQVGPEFEAEARKLRAAYGNPHTVIDGAANEANTSYCFDASGGPQAECKGVTIGTKLVRCADPNHETSFTGDGLPPNDYYPTRACEMSIDYHDRQTEEAFYKLQGLMYVKFAEIFGTIDKP